MALLCTHVVLHTQFLLPGYCPEAGRLCPQITLQTYKSPPHLVNLFLLSTHVVSHTHSCPNFHCVSEAGWCWKGVLHKLYFLVWGYTFLLVEVLQILVGGKQVWVGVAGQECDQPAGQSAGHAGPGTGLEGRAGHRPAVPAHHGGPAGGGPPQRPDHAAHAAKPSSVARTYQGRSLSVLCGYFIE